MVGKALRPRSCHQTPKKKSNPADALSYWLNYYQDQIKQKSVEMYCVLGYVTQRLMKSQHKVEKST